MKKYIVIASLALCALGSVKAAEVQGQENPFSKESVDSTVDSARSASRAALLSNGDDKAYRKAIVTIEDFYSETTVASPEDSSSPEKRTRVLRAYNDLKSLLRPLEDKIDGDIDSLTDRKDRLAERTTGGTVYGIDLAEARGMVITQLGSDIAGLKRLKLRMLKLDKQLAEGITVLGKQ